MKVALLIVSVVSVTTAMPGATDEVCQTMKETFMKKIQTRVARDFVPLSTVKKSKFHSCDINSNRALEGAEFAGCLHPLVSDSSQLGEDALMIRLDCFRKFTRQADKNDDGMVTKEEFDNWTKLGFFDMVLEASEQANIIDNTITDVDVLIDDTPADSRQVKEVAKIIKALVKGDTGLAIVRVYGLVTGTDVSRFDPLLIQSVSNALAALSAGDIPAAIGNVFSVVAGVVLGTATDIAVTQATISAVGILLTHIINQDQNLGQYVGPAVSGILLDLTEISSDSASALTQIVISIVNGSFDATLTDALITTLSRALAEIAGVNDVARDSLIALIQAIRDQNQQAIFNNVFVVISAIVGVASGVGGDTVTSLTLIVQSLIESNRGEAALHTATLYNLLTNGGSCSTGLFSFLG